MPASNGAGRAGETCVNSKWPKLMLMSGITSAWLLYEIATATEAPGRALAILQYGLLACARIGLVSSLPKDDRTILEVIAAATGAEDACDRHCRHRDPIRDPLRLQPVAGIFPDHDLDQLAPPGLVDRFRQQLLVPDVVVARFLLVHRTPRTRARPEQQVSIKLSSRATGLRKLYP